MKKKIDPNDTDKAASRRDFQNVQRKYGFTAAVAMRDGGPEQRRARQRELVRITKVLAECATLDGNEFPPWKGEPIWKYHVHLRKTA